MSRVDHRLGAALVLLALVWLWLVRTQIPDAGAEWPGPSGFPQLLGVVLAILGLSLIAAPGSRTPEPGSLRTAGAVFALLMLYAFLLDRAGFVISTAGLMIAALAVVLRIRRWLFVAAFAVAFALACWAVFNSLLGIPLPSGTWMAAAGVR